MILPFAALPHRPPMTLSPDSLPSCGPNYIPNSTHAWPDSNAPSLGDKIHRLGTIRPSFLIALNQIVDEMLVKIDAEQSAAAAHNAG